MLNIQFFMLCNLSLILIFKCYECAKLIDCDKTLMYYVKFIYFIY